MSPRRVKAPGTIAEPAGNHLGTSSVAGRVSGGPRTFTPPLGGCDAGPTPQAPTATSCLRLTLPEPPSANRWWRKWQNRMVLSTEARDYKQATYLRAKAASRKRAIPSGHVAVSVDWYRSRRAGDLDKRLGVVLDALQGAAYENDSQVVELTARRFDDKNNPRLEVTITALPETGT